MRYGVVILPEHPWSTARANWVGAEEFGFDHAWTYDHLSWRWLRDDPWFAAVPTLTAAALATTRIRLGTLVANPGLRHPATFAKELMTLDDMSGGRIVCGIGAGGYDADALRPRTSPDAGQAVPGQAVPGRAARFAEFVELTDRLLRGQRVEYDGAHYRCQALELHPGCVQRPRLPLALAAAGPDGMRLAARYADTWVTSGKPNGFEPERFDRALPTLTRQLEELTTACTTTGRDPASIDRLLLTGASVGGVLDSHGAFQDATGLFEAAGFTDLVLHWPRPEFPFQARMDVFQDIAAGLHARAGQVR